MYEYTCLKCGTIYYSSAEYSKLEKEAFCDGCNGDIFYSPRELKRGSTNLEWLIKEINHFEKVVLSKKNNDGKKYIIYNLDEVKASISNNAVLAQINRLERIIKEEL